MNETDHLNGNTHVYADGLQTVLASDDQGVMLTQLAMRAGITVTQAMTVVRELEDLQPVHAQDRHPAADSMERFILRFVRPLVSLKYLSVDCLLFSNGFGHLIGCEKQTDIVRRHGGSKSAKANVNKYIKRYQRALGLGQTVDQRTVDGCQAMREARLRQLGKES